MLNLKKAAFGAMTFVLMCGSMAMAQRPEQKDDGRFKKEPAPKVQAQTVARATIDDIHASLKSFGYNVNAKKLNNGHVILELDVPYNGKMVPVDVELSNDGSKVWLTAWFRQLGQGETIPANVMAQLMECNGRYGPTHFSISGSKQLYMGSPLDNRHLSPEDLRREIDIFAQVYVQTEPLWNHNNWSVQVGGGR